jgi:hypothetical protein
MAKSDMLEMALDRIIGELDDIEGHEAMDHSLEECPDPLNCKMHEGELSENMTPDGGVPAAVKIEVHKVGMPTLDGKELPAEGKGHRAEEGLSPAEAEALKKLLK